MIFTAFISMPSHCECREDAEEAMTAIEQQAIDKQHEETASRLMTMQPIEECLFGGGSYYNTQCMGMGWTTSRHHYH